MVEQLIPNQQAGGSSPSAPATFNAEKEQKMDLTEENKKHIDNMSYEELLRRWRFAPVGDPWFQGETGKYWGDRMAELRKTSDHVGASKRIGWEK